MVVTNNEITPSVPDNVLKYFLPNKPRIQKLIRGRSGTRATKK
jgi:hypothetical protein